MSDGTFTLEFKGYQVEIQHYGGQWETVAFYGDRGEAIKRAAELREAMNRDTGLITEESYERVRVWDVALGGELKRTFFVA